MRIVTWNMAFWSHGKHHDRAWNWVLDDLRPDVFLCQEANPPDWVRRDRTVIWTRAYPSGSQTWGTGLVTALPCQPARIPDLDNWFEALPTLSGETEPAAIQRADGWLATGRVMLPRIGETLFVSVHNPSKEIDRARLRGVDVTSIKLRKNPDLWLLDVVFYFLKTLLGQRLLVGGDFNYSRLLDETMAGGRDRGNNEFFDRIGDEGFVSIHRRFHPADERTYFKEGRAHHQLDYLYGDTHVASIAKKCWVEPHSVIAEFSDHAPLVADIEL